MTHTTIETIHSPSGGKPNEKKTVVETIKPGISGTTPTKEYDADDLDLIPNTVLLQYADLNGSFQTSFSFISAHSDVVSQANSDLVLALAFQRGMKGSPESAVRPMVSQALILQYCTMLGTISF